MTTLNEIESPADASLADAEIQASLSLEYIASAQTVGDLTKVSITASDALLELIRQKRLSLIAKAHRDYQSKFESDKTVNRVLDAVRADPNIDAEYRRAMPSRFPRLDRVNSPEQQRRVDEDEAGARLAVDQRGDAYDADFGK